MDTAAIVKSYHKAHNASQHLFKAQLAPLRKVAARAVAEWEASPIRGAEPSAFIHARLNKFCTALRDGTAASSDADLLPAAHPSVRGDADPWAALVSAEDRLASLAKSALSGITRATLRKHGLAELHAAHQRLVHLYSVNFASNSVEKSATGVQRADLVSAAALVHEELERRGTVISPQHQLYKEACAVRALSRTSLAVGRLVHKADSVVLHLPGLGSLAVTNRLTATDVEKAAALWSPDGSKYHTAIREPAEVGYAVVLEKSDESGVEFNFSAGAVTPDFTEVFVYGPLMSGSLLVGSTSLTLRKDLRPYVLTESAVSAGWMPPDGDSALPPSLEQDVPPDLRWWKSAEGEDPREIRDQLVKTGLFDSVVIVNGVPRRVVTKVFAPEAYGPAPEVFAHAQVEVSAAEMLTDMAGVEPTLVEPDDVVSKVADLIEIDDYLVGSQNTEAAREALSKLGRPFCVAGDTSIVFVSARAVPGVEYIAAAKDERLTPVRLLKNDSSEMRYVLGIVLEPDTVDSQNDIYSATEVMKSAHTFLAQFRNAGLQHQTLVNDRVRIVESYLAPADFDMNGEPVKKGTWLMGMVIDDDTIWAAVKSGDLTGFSIGGSAIRTPL